MKIVLRQPPPAWGLPSISPFCVKLETYLKMAGVPYEVRGGSPVGAPKGKIPYADIDGKRMGDSTLIIEHLKKHHGDPLDAPLTAEERATMLAWQRLVEDHLYFAGAWLRWATEDSCQHVRTYFLKVLPPVLGGLIFSKIRKNFLKQMQAQGMGRHTREEIIDFARTDITALATFLGDKPYFMGEKPTSLDATMYGFLVQQIGVPWDGPLKEHTRKYPNLIGYCERMRDRYWK